MAAQLITRTHEALSPAARQARELEESRQLRLRIRRETDLKWLMSQPAGRRIVARLMAEAKLMEKVSTPEQIGARNAAIAFSGELVALDYRAWLLMLEEAHADSVHTADASKSLHP